MGCDIHLMTEIKKGDKWELNTEKIFGEENRENDSPFDYRNYSLFTFLAGVRNYDDIKPIFKPRGLPKDSDTLNIKLGEPYEVIYYFAPDALCETNRDEIENDSDYHNFTYITLKELIEFDYEQKATERETYREFLGQWFFKELDLLKTLGEPDDVRIVFWFDN